MARQWLIISLQVWNFLAGASGVFLFPYLNLYLAQRGLSSSQIGLLAALRPWLSAPVGMVGSALADKHQIHAQLLVATAAVSILLRSCLPLGQGVPVLFIMLLVAELAGAPTNILADSTVLSNCKDVSLWAITSVVLCCFLHLVLPAKCSCSKWVYLMTEGMAPLHHSF
jgi:hypothetical protein